MTYEDMLNLRKVYEFLIDDSDVGMDRVYLCIKMVGLIEEIEEFCRTA